MHNNYVVGKEAKIQRFRDFGLWKLKDGGGSEGSGVDGAGNRTDTRDYDEESSKTTVVDDDDDDDEDDDVDKEDAKQAMEAVVRAASSTLGSAADADTITDIAAAGSTDKPAEMQLHTEDSEKESKEHESLVFSDESTPNAVRSPSAVDYASRVSTEMEDDRKKWRAELNAIAKKHLGNIDELIGGTPGDSGTVDFWKKKSVFSKD